VYERNGGSSEEFAAACGTGADREGPLSSSGTNNTISTTRMIAPVSRSFTRLSKMGAEPLQSTVGFAVGRTERAPGREGRTGNAPRASLRHTSVYPKPLQRRPHRIERTEDDDAIPRLRGRTGDFAACRY
jgi:hypothetical protein